MSRRGVVKHRRVVRSQSLIVLVLFIGVMRASVGQTATPARETDYAAQGASILQKLAAGHYGGVEVHFDERMAKDLPQAELSDQWKQMVVQAGTFVKVTTTTVTQEFWRLSCRRDVLCIRARRGV
jgi:hypothetical protein